MSDTDHQNQTFPPHCGDVDKLAFAKRLDALEAAGATDGEVEAAKIVIDREIEKRAEYKLPKLTCCSSSSSSRHRVGCTWRKPGIPERAPGGVTNYKCNVCRSQSRTNLAIGWARCEACGSKDLVACGEPPIVQVANIL